MLKLSILDKLYKLFDGFMLLSTEYLLGVTFLPTLLSLRILSSLSEILELLLDRFWYEFLIDSNICRYFELFLHNFENENAYCHISLGLTKLFLLFLFSLLFKYKALTSLSNSAKYQINHKSMYTINSLLWLFSLMPNLLSNILA